MQLPNFISKGVIFKYISPAVLVFLRLWGLPHASGMVLPLLSIASLWELPPVVAL